MFIEVIGPNFVAFAGSQPPKLSPDDLLKLIARQAEQIRGEFPSPINAIRQLNGALRGKPLDLSYKAAPVIGEIIRLGRAVGNLSAVGLAIEAGICSHTQNPPV